MLLRKEVYLAAAEAVAAGLMAVDRRAHLDLSDQELMRGYVDKVPSIMKVHIIATDETVRTLVYFSGELSEALLNLFVRRRPLILLKQRLDILVGQFDTFTRANSPMLVEQATQEAQTINASLDPQHRQFAVDCVREALRLARLVNPILFSIRKELGLPTNEAEILKISDEGAAKALETAVKFLLPPPSSSGGAPPPAS